MSKRAKVLRDPYLGPGLLMVEGRQYPFLMGGLWRSEVPAKPGLWVDVDFDEHGNIRGITAVPEAQLNEERADIKHKTAFTLSKFWLIRLLAVGLLAASWLFLTAVSVQVPFLGNVQLTFWQVLGYVNTGSHLPSLVSRDNPDPGFYGLLAVAALIGPFLQHLTKHKPAELGSLMPLVFTLAIGLIARARLVNFNTGFSAQAQMAGGLSVGLGTYLSIVVALYLAVMSIKNVLVNEPASERKLTRSEKAAA